jgi:predicted anti-sigma-YlaC factor YlaD
MTMSFIDSIHIDTMIIEVMTMTMTMTMTMMMMMIIIIIVISDITENDSGHEHRIDDKVSIEIESI